MSVHRRLHSQSTESKAAERPHICTFCGTGFARRSKLIQHLQKSHAALTPNKTTANTMDESS